MDSLGALVCVRIQPETCFSRCFALCSLVWAGCSRPGSISCRQQRRESVSSQATGDSSLSQAHGVSPGCPPGSVHPARLGVSPASSKAKSTLRSLHPAGNARSVAIRREDFKECAQHWIALCWGRESVYKKSNLGKSLSLETGGEGRLEISKNIMDILFPPKPNPNLSHSVSTATQI